MKITIQISVIDVKMDDLGIEQPEKFVPFHFNANNFYGYWIVQDEHPVEICFYVGGNKFFTSYSAKAVELFESLLRMPK